MRLSLPLFYAVIVGLCSVLFLFKLFRGFKDEREDFDEKILPYLFTLSGIASLIYQIAWQRTLFQMIGVNSESVILIVSIFMLGLGVGSFFGGHLTKKFPNKLAILFLGFEIAIGLFGVISLPLFSYIKPLVWNLSYPSLILVLYFLIGLPTLFMGATLPILVDYVNQKKKNAGHSFSLLYFFNTMGAGVASLLTVDLLFVYLDLQESIYIAAFFNFLVGLCTYFYIKKSPILDLTTSKVIQDEKTNDSKVLFSPKKIFLIAFLSGFISLSQEILWVRGIGFSVSGMPQVFGHILAFFLFGIAGGALYIRRFLYDSELALKQIKSYLLASCALYGLSLYLISVIVKFSALGGLLTSYLLVSIIAFLQGGLIIVLCDLLSRSNKETGMNIAKIYIFNILGSTLGPIITGYLIVHFLGLTLSVLLFACLGILMLLLLGLDRKIIILSLATILLLVGNHYFFNEGLLYNLQVKSTGSFGEKFIKILENRHGTITVLEKEKGFIDIYGGGGFDGKWSQGFFDNPSLKRAYTVALIHENPKEVLQIGMSTGSWSRIFADYGKIQKLDIIEINPGYFELSKDFPGHDIFTEDPRINLHFTDARRWLIRNPNRKFDLIVMNTPHHWRSQVSNLLSMEYLELAKKHLNEGGAVYFNATNSPDAVYTASRVFKHVWRYSNLYIASDKYRELTLEQRLENLLAFNYRVAPKSEEEKIRQLKKFSNTKLTDFAEFYRGQKGLKLVKDQNMLTEYKRPYNKFSRFYWTKDLISIEELEQKYLETKK